MNTSVDVLTMQREVERLEDDAWKASLRANEALKALEAAEQANLHAWREVEDARRLLRLLRRREARS